MRGSEVGRERLQAGWPMAPVALEAGLGGEVAEAVARLRSIEQNQWGSEHDVEAVHDAVIRLTMRAVHVLGPVLRRGAGGTLATAGVTDIDPTATSAELPPIFRMKTLTGHILASRPFVTAGLWSVLSPASRIRDLGSLAPGASTVARAALAPRIVAELQASGVDLATVWEMDAESIGRWTDLEAGVVARYGSTARKLDDGDWVRLTLGIAWLLSRRLAEVPDVMRGLRIGVPAVEALVDRPVSEILRVIETGGLAVPITVAGPLLAATALLADRALRGMVTLLQHSSEPLVGNSRVAEQLAQGTLPSLVTVAAEYRTAGTIRNSLRPPLTGREAAQAIARLHIPPALFYQEISQYHTDASPVPTWTAVQGWLKGHRARLAVGFIVMVTRWVLEREAAIERRPLPAGRIPQLGWPAERSEGPRTQRLADLRVRAHLSQATLAGLLDHLVPGCGITETRINSYEAQPSSRSFTLFEIRLIQVVMDAVLAGEARDPLTPETLDRFLAQTGFTIVDLAGAMLDVYQPPRGSADPVTTLAVSIGVFHGGGMPRPNRAFIDGLRLTVSTMRLRYLESHVRREFEGVPAPAWYLEAERELGLRIADVVRLAGDRLEQTAVWRWQAFHRGDQSHGISEPDLRTVQSMLLDALAEQRQHPPADQERLERFLRASGLRQADLVPLVEARYEVVTGTRPAEHSIEVRVSWLVNDSAERPDHRFRRIVGDVIEQVEARLGLAAPAVSPLPEREVAPSRRPPDPLAAVITNFMHDQEYSLRALASDTLAEAGLPVSEAALTELEHDLVAIALGYSYAMPDRAQTIGVAIERATRERNREIVARTVLGVLVRRDLAPAEIAQSMAVDPAVIWAVVDDIRTVDAVTLALIATRIPSLAPLLGEMGRSSPSGDQGIQRPGE